MLAEGCELMSKRVNKSTIRLKFYSGLHKLYKLWLEFWKKIVLTVRYIYLESPKNVHSAWPTVDYVPHFTTQHEAHKWPNVYKSGQASAICLGWVWQHIQVAFGKDEIRTHNKSIKSWVGQLLHRTYAQKTFFFVLKQFA